MSGVSFFGLLLPLNKNKHNKIMKNANITPTLDLLISFSKTSGAQFVSVKNYENSKGEVANHVVNLNVNYENAKAKDIEYLKDLDVSTLDDKGLGKDLMEKARVALLGAAISPNKARSKGQTEAYRTICNGVSAYIGQDGTKHGEIKIFAMAVSKKVIVQGIYPKVNSRPLTIAKNIIKKELKATKFRRLTLSNVGTVKVQGEELNFANY